MGLGKRKAVHIKYGQAVPLKYTIDPENCIYLTRGKCGACKKFCPTGAINYDQKEEIVTVQTGSIILAPGFKPFDPSNLDFYGYEEMPDVVTSLEYERLLSASGPYMGHLVRPSDEREPQRIAWIQCVGSRNTNNCNNGYCSNVCCMYAIKQAIVTKEHLKTTSPDLYIFYMDIRSHGKEFERYYEKAREGGIKFIRARPHTIDPGRHNRGVKIRYFNEKGQERLEEFDMMVLSIGLEAPAEAMELAEKFGIELTPYGFAKTSSFEPVSTKRPGIYVTGAFNGPKDIPQAVTEASTASAEAANILVEAKGSMTKDKIYPPERDTAQEEARIGVFVCSCGINIASVVDVKEVCEYAKTLPNVVYVENNLFTCSADTQNIIATKIKENNLNRIVIAACTPRTHEPLFQDTLREAGLNGYLVEMANIRNHNSWVHQNDPIRATKKAKDQVKMAVAKASLNYPLKNPKVEVIQQALIIGGGISGMHSALSLAEQGYDCVLLEKTDTLGGNAWNLRSTYKDEKIKPYLTSLIKKVESHEKIRIIKNAELKSVEGSVGNFVSEIEINGKKETLRYGVAIIATGAKELKPSEYMYGEDERILTHLELDQLLMEDEKKIRDAKSILFIQCVGSRNSERPYCSRVCCTHTVENAIHLKRMNPDMNIYVLYRDMRTYGDREDLYKEARDMGVMFIHYDLGRKPKVLKENEELLVEVFDPISQLPLKIYVDYLVLASAIIPNENNEIVELFKFSVNEDGFYNEAHPKLRPVDMAVDGLFVAGLCNYPKPIEESIAQAKAASARASVLLSKEEMELDAIKSYVTENCDGCALCIDVCPYQAISLEEREENGRIIKKVRTDIALCKGCGMCEATCPKGGILVHGFTIDQIRAQVDAIIESMEEKEEVAIAI